MARFVDDSHRHGDCVLSLTVQVYTVISLSRALIAEHSLIETLLQTYMQHCNDKIDSKFKLFPIAFSFCLETVFRVSENAVNCVRESRSLLAFF